MQSVIIRPSDSDGEKAPDFRIFAGQTELGAAWKESSRADRPNLSVTLDDHSFPNPAFAALVESDDGRGLFWSRRSSA